MSNTEDQPEEEFSSNFLGLPRSNLEPISSGGSNPVEGGEFLENASGTIVEEQQREVPGSGMQTRTSNNSSQQNGSGDTNRPIGAPKSTKVAAPSKKKLAEAKRQAEKDAEAGRLAAMTAAFAIMQEELKALQTERAERLAAERERSEGEEGSVKKGDGSPPPDGLGTSSSHRRQRSNRGSRDRNRSHSDNNGLANDRQEFRRDRSRSRDRRSGDRYNSRGVSDFSPRGWDERRDGPPPWSSNSRPGTGTKYVPIIRDYPAERMAEVRAGDQAGRNKRGSERRGGSPVGDRDRDEERADPIRAYEEWMRGLGLGNGVGYRLADTFFREGFCHEGFPQTITGLDDDEFPEAVFRLNRGRILRAVGVLRASHAGAHGQSARHGGPQDCDPPAANKGSRSAGTTVVVRGVMGLRGLGQRSSGEERPSRSSAPGGLSGGAHTDAGSGGNGGSHQAEEDQGEGMPKGITLAAYTILDEDGNSFKCTSRGEAMGRLRALQGTIRFMGKERFLCLVKDLQLSVAEMFDTAESFLFPDRNTIEDTSHILHSLGGMRAIKDSSVVTTNELMEAALKLEFKRTDLREGSLTLKSFLLLPDNTNPTWGREGTSSGRRSMASAVRSLEKFLIAFGSPVYRGALAELADKVEEGSYLMYHDVYVWVMLQGMLFHWSNDVRTMSRTNRSSHFQDATVESPAKVRDLLQRYAKELLEAAEGKGRGSWEAAPHSRFYSKDLGELSRCIFDGAQLKALGGKDRDKSVYAGGDLTANGPVLKNKEKDTKGDPSAKEAAEAKKARDQKTICGHHLKGLMGLLLPDGRSRRCERKNCERRHPKSLGEVTLVEATENCGIMMSKEDKTHMEGLTTWKAS